MPSNLEKHLLFTFYLASTEPHFLRLPRSEGLIDSLSLITYLALRIDKGEMDDNNAAIYTMQGSNHNITTRIMRIYFGLILEVEAEIYATLERIATLGEVFLAASGGIIYCKGIVMGIRQIATPETDEDLA